jgi:hypothetical protein
VRNTSGSGDPVKIRKIRVERMEVLLLLAFLPALLFFLFVHFPKYGYLLAIIPTLIVLSISLLQRTIVSLPILIGILCVATLSNYFIFVTPRISEFLRKFRDWEIRKRFSWCKRGVIQDFGL